MSKATENGSADSHTYTYDAQGQLIREYDPDKELYLGYQYDAGGNLTEVRSYPAGAEGYRKEQGQSLKLLLIVITIRLCEWIQADKSGLL